MLNSAIDSFLCLLSAVNISDVHLLQIQWMFLQNITTHPQAYSINKHARLQIHARHWSHFTNIDQNGTGCTTFISCDTKFNWYQTITSSNEKYWRISWKKMGRSRYYHCNAHSVYAYFSNNTHKYKKKLIILWHIWSEMIQKCKLRCLVCQSIH